MRPLRRLDDIIPTGEFFDSQVVAQLESCNILRTEIAAKKRVIGRHRHAVAQLYYVLSGEIDVEVGSADFHASQGDMLIIPPGFSHLTRNRADEPAVLLELFLPPPSAIEPAAELCDRGEEAPSMACLRRADERRADADAEAGLSVQWLASPSDGGPDFGVALVHQEPGHHGPGLHIHDCDQIHVVLEGRLTAEVAGRPVIAGRLDLVIVGAGVPYESGNAGPGRLTYLSFYVPGLGGDTTWRGQAVEFSLKSSAPQGVAAT